MQRLGPTKKRKRICSECVDCFGQRTVFMCWTESGLCTRDGWIRTDSQRSQFHPTNLFLSLRLWCKDLVPQKGGKGKAVSVLIVFGHWNVFMHWTESGLCTRDGWIRTDPQRGQFLPTNLFPGLICDAKSWSHKKKNEKDMQWVCLLFQPRDCLYAPNREWTLFKRWVTKSWPTKELVSPKKTAKKIWR